MRFTCMLHCVLLLKTENNEIQFLTWALHRKPSKKYKNVSYINDWPSRLNSVFSSFVCACMRKQRMNIVRVKYRRKWTVDRNLWTEMWTVDGSESVLTTPPCFGLTSKVQIIFDVAAISKCNGSRIKSVWMLLWINLKIKADIRNLRKSQYVMSYFLKSN